MNQAREQAKWKEEKGVEINEPTKQLPATTLSDFLLDELKASGIYSAYLEAREAGRICSTNGNQFQSNHGTSNLPRRQEPLELTSAERLRT